MIAAAAPDLDRTLSALADPTRRAILQRLAQGEARVTDVAAPFPISLNSVSKHIRLLERAALVRRRKAGREYWLSLDPEPLAQADDWLREQRAAWTARLHALDTLLTAEDQTRNDAGARRARARKGSQR